MPFNDTINQILDARERRTTVLKAKLQNHPFVITFSLNIPGPKKTSVLKKQFIQKHFFEYLNILTTNYEVLEHEFFSDSAGYQYCLTLKNGDPYDLKKISLNFEDMLGPNGALIDIDIYVDIFKKITRENLAELPRKCFICEGYAKECAFKQRHDCEELNNFVDERLASTVGFTISKEYIFQDLIKKISDGIIKPGDRLKEEELASKYEVSRTKIREVMSMLVEHQVVISKKNVGITLKDFTINELIEIMDLRMHLKLIIFKDILEHSSKNETKVVIEKILENLKNVNENNLDHLKIWNWKFYNMIFSLSDKFFTKDIFNNLEILFSHIRYKISLKSQKWFYKIHLQHITICETILERDEKLLEEILDSYLNILKIDILKEYS